MGSQVFTINGLEVRVVAGEFVLVPYYVIPSKKFIYNGAGLGVVESFGKSNIEPERLLVKLKPFYKVRMPEDGSWARAEIKESFGSLHPDFFPAVYAGPAEAIAQALREVPFSKMEQLANAIEGLSEPYDDSLVYLFRHRNEAFVESA